MTLKNAAQHSCIFQYMDDPQGRFLFIRHFNEFYPISESECLISVFSAFIIDYYQLLAPIFTVQEELTFYTYVKM